MASERARAVEFRTDAPLREPLLVAGLAGSERISEPYEFTLDLLGRQADVDLEALVRSPAAIELNLLCLSGRVQDADAGGPRLIEASEKMALLAKECARRRGQGKAEGRPGERDRHRLGGPGPGRAVGAQGEAGRGRARR